MCNLYHDTLPPQPSVRSCLAEYFKDLLGKAMDWLHQTVFGPNLFVSSSDPKIPTWVAVITQR